MPFSKTITDPSGVSSTYWVISNAQANFTSKTVMVTVSGWLDADAYTTEKSPSSRRSYYFTVSFDDIPSISSDNSISMAELYAAIAQQLASPVQHGPASPLAGATEVA